MNRPGNVQPETRYAMLTLALLGSVPPIARFFRHAYGRTAARRLSAGMLVALGAQQVVVACVLRRKPHCLGAVDLMTLSRGVASALLLGLVASGVRDRRGPAGRLGWCSIVYGAIVCDWLDGPLARRSRTSEAGAIFDLEADSWLTLCTALATTAWGRLPLVVTIPAILRYPAVFHLVSRTGYARATSDDPPWARRVGIAQMALFLAALAPFGGRVTQKVVRVAVPLETAVQLVCLAVLYRRKAKG